jgi:hypothetical protein
MFDRVRRSVARFAIGNGIRYGSSLAFACTKGVPTDVTTGVPTERIFRSNLHDFKRVDAKRTIDR